MPRVRRRLRLLVGSQKGPQTRFTQDISPGGFSMELPVSRELLPGADLHGELELAGMTLPFTGKVAWTSPGDPRVRERPRVGVRFTGITHTFFALLKPLLGR
jgi:hypothetical protein